MKLDLVVGVLALQGAVTEHLQKFYRLGLKATEVKNPEHLESIDALVLPGGESTTIGYLMQENGWLEAVRECGKQGKAIMGTCAGMVLLSRHVIDGRREQPKLELMDIGVKRNAFGRQRESFETPLPFKGINQPVEAVFIRAPLVEEWGKEVEPLANLEEGTVAVRQGRMLALSFHPELTQDLSVYRFFVESCVGR